MSIAATRETPHVPPHAPEVGRVRRFLGPLYFTGVFWFRFHRFGVRVLPYWVMLPLMVLFVAFFSTVLRNVRAAVASNLEVVLGPCGWWERQVRIYKTIWYFAWCLTERYQRLVTDQRFLVGVEGLEHWRELNASAEGFILVTAHIGAWEVGGSMLPSFQATRRVHVVREAETDPRAQQFLAELIRGKADDLYTTHFAEDPQLGVDLLDALRRGEIVALQGDRPRTGGRTADISLFGRPYPVPVGPLALARAAGVPILPVFVFREGLKRYRCSLRPPIRVGGIGGGGSRQAEIDQALQRFATELQWAITHRPYQWFCLRKLWG
jgi:phosphatidylinositol dimannoside acyltransferase